MSKVLVDRELLERAVSIPTKESLEANQAAIVDRGRAHSDIRELLAQPAEAEGVEVVAWRTPSGCLYDSKEAAEKNVVTGHICKTEPLVLQSNHLAALSAVTAERDRLREDRDSQQRVCIAEMEKVSQLRAEVEGLRSDAERLDRLDLECEGYGCEGVHEGNRWMIDGPFRTVRDAIDAAMAAKESTHEE